MTLVAELYDQHVAEHYDRDRLGIFAFSRRLALSQLPKSLPVAPHCLDIGCGTGLLLRDLKERFPQAELWGLDPSQAMLDAAKRQSAARGILGHAEDAEHHLAPNSLDLISTHFVLAYVEPAVVFGQARRLLKPGGVFSLVTSTFETLQTIQGHAGAFMPEKERLSAHLPATAEELVAQVEQAGFRVLARDPIEYPLTFNNVEELYRFGVQDGWLVQYVAVLDQVRALPKEMLESLFPLHDRLVAVAITAEKLG